MVGTGCPPIYQYAAVGWTPVFDAGRRVGSPSPPNANQRSKASTARGSPLACERIADAACCRICVRVSRTAVPA